MDAALVRIGKRRKAKAKRYLVGKGERRKVKGERCFLYLMFPLVPMSKDNE
jgi:hypothetical protein